MTASTYRTYKAFFASFLTAALVATGLVLVTDPASAAFPGTNGKIAFTTNRDTDGQLGEIYVMDADGSGQTRLTDHPAHDDDAAFSPNGQKIVFASNRAGDDAIGDYEIYVMKADGTDVQQLTDNSVSDSNPSWSPDGTQIAFQRNGEIYVMNADGSAPTQLTDSGGHDGSPVWSPDGQWIAFTSTRDDNPEVYVMSSDGSGQTNLTKNSALDADPEWSPDGEQLAFESLRDGYMEIYVMNADGSDVTNLTDATTNEGNPTWSPDGTKIAFASDRDDSEDSEIYVMDADGSGAATRLTTSEHGDLPSSWGPAVSGDVEPPVVTCDTPAPSFVLGGSHATDVTATATDADSTPSTWTVSADVTAGDVATVGVKSKSVTAVDDAGNETTVSCSFVVQYAFGGFLAPLPQSKNKAGSTIPVKFKLGGAAGGTISDAEALALVGDTCRIKVTFGTAPQVGCPIYNQVAKVFQYDLKTAKGLPKGTYTISVEIHAPDGSGLLQTQTIQVSIV